jgi:F-type H+-transporting ATPase subunit a
MPKFLRSQLFWIFVVFAVVGIALYVLGIRLTKLDISVRGEALACFGGVQEGKFCSADTVFPFTNSTLMTIVVDVLLLLTIFFGVRNMQLIPRGFQNIVEAMVEAFYNFAQGVDRKNIAKFFPVCATIFFFVLYSNMFALIPGVGSIGGCIHPTEVHSATETAPPPAFAESLPGSCGEGLEIIPILRSPSADLNATAAIALWAVFMVEVFGFQALGLGYLTKFFNFREGFMGAFVGILELISEVVRIVAFAFRLFGNIFAGEVVLVVMAYLFPYLLPLPFYGLETFVAFIQAVIFSVLTLVFMSLAVQAHGGHDEHGHPEMMPVEAGDVPGHGGAH